MTPLVPSTPLGHDTPSNAQPDVVISTPALPFWDVVTVIVFLRTAWDTECYLGYGMLPRLDVGADARMFHIVIDDNLVGIVIQRHALSKLIFGRNDNLFGTRELNRALGCTTVRVELAYGRLCDNDRHPT